MAIASHNPATGETIRVFDELTDDALEAKLQQAQRAFGLWRSTGFAQRKALMLELAKHLRQYTKHYSNLMAMEMGKPLTAGRAEIEKCAWACEYYAEHAEVMLAPELIATDASESAAVFEPLGAVLAVMPWNFPFWQVIRFAAPAIMAGNVGLLKHASNVPQCSLALEEAFIAAGFPTGVFQSLLVSSARVEKVIADARVAAITLTGSGPAGAQVASQAGRLIKKTVLELGGSDPFIVLPDADIAEAAKVAATARFQNNGQSCIAAKRFIAVASVVDEFAKQFKAQVESMVVGDPLDDATQIGPLASVQQLRDCETQVAESVAMGAAVVTGGHRLERPGYFYTPTMLRDVRKGMPVYDQEVFGPVAPVITVVDVEEAIAVANDTPYGLGSSLWTKDLMRAKALAQRIQAGSVFINGLVKSDPRLPFGGIKQSGYGRELGRFGIREFVNVKTVWMK